MLENGGCKVATFGGPGLFELRSQSGWAHASLRSSCTGAEELMCQSLDTAVPLSLAVEGDLPLYLWLSEPGTGVDASITFEWSFTAAICGVKPANQASAYSSEVPVFPAAGMS